MWRRNGTLTGLGQVWGHADTCYVASKKQGTCAVAQAVSGRPVTPEACVPVQVSPCCDFVVDKLAGFAQSVWVFLWLHHLILVISCATDAIYCCRLLRASLNDVVKNRSRELERWATYIHTYIHAYIHAYIYTYIHTYIHTYIYNDKIFISIHINYIWNM